MITVKQQELVVFTRTEDGHEIIGVYVPYADLDLAELKEEYLEIYPSQVNDFDHYQFVSWLENECLIRKVTRASEVWLGDCEEFNSVFFKSGL